MMNIDSNQPFAIVFPEFYGVHGIARYIDSFLVNLPEDTPKIYLIVGDEHRHTRDYPNVEIIHLPFESTRLSKFLWILKARKQLRKLYRQGKIKAVNLHIPPLIPGLMLPREIPLILTAHTTYLGMSGLFYKEQYFESQWGALEVAIKRWMEKVIFNRSHKIITLTEQGKAEIQQYGYQQPIAVIPNGVDTQLFQPDAKAKKQYDVLFSGRIETRKGSRGLVEVCQLLVQNKPDIKILIVGYGDDDEWVNQELGQYENNIKLTGKVPFTDMQSYYHQSRLYVSTSYYEGLPGTCLEAMAMGLPAVVWQFLFYEGLVVEAQTGALIAPNQYAQMAAKVVELLADNNKLVNMSHQARLKVEQCYHWRKLAADIIQECQ